MNPLKIIKVAEIRKKIAVIPGKLILSIIAIFALHWQGNPPDSVNQMLHSPVSGLLFFAFYYGVISYVSFFIRIMHNWILGIVVAGAAVFAVWQFRSEIGQQNSMIIYSIMLFGGPILDVLNILRYLNLKDEVIREQEESDHRAYGDGYNSGYESGYERGKRDGARLNSGPSARTISHRNQNYLPYEEDEDYEDDYYEDDYPEEDDYYIEENEDWDEPCGFFDDCRDDAAVKRRYHDLCKVYHPDSGNGSAEIFQQITEEYHAIMR